MIRYSIVGMSGTVLDLSLLFVLVEFLQWHVLSAAAVSFVAAATSNFVLNKKWTFKNRNKAYHQQYLKFFLVSVVGLLLTILLMFLLNIILGIWYLLAKALTSLIVLLWNYLGNRQWTFRPVIKEAILDKSYHFEYSVVIPTYNEESVIEKTLSEIRNFFLKSKLSYEIIVVDDGSSDQTTEIIKKGQNNSPDLKLIVLDRNTGKGNALKIGALSSDGKYVLFADADNSTPIEELTKLQKYIPEYDVVVGSRKLLGSVIETKRASYRRLISKIGSFLSTALIKDIKDTQCGFKLIKREVVEQIVRRQKITGYGFDLELLALAQHYELKILEVPIRWIDRKESRFRPIRDTLLTLGDFLLIQYNFLTGKY